MRFGTSCVARSFTGHPEIKLSLFPLENKLDTELAMPLLPLLSPSECSPPGSSLYVTNKLLKIKLLFLQPLPKAVTTSNQTYFIYTYGCK